MGLKAKKRKSQHIKNKQKSCSLGVDIGSLKLKNPIMAASGTFGYGEEMTPFYDINNLGAIVTKTITVTPREGNPTPRIVETPSGMLNSIGLENKGLKDFIFNKVKILERYATHVIVSISGNEIEEFCELAEELSKTGCISALELNLSCPNVKHATRLARYKLVAQDTEATENVITAVKKHTNLPIITKLSPNVTDIKEIAKAAEGAGSNAISAINTLLGMSVDVETGRPRLGNIVGGLSGPAIKPIALQFIREISSCVKIPIIGIGGIMTAEDVIEFMLCGAAAVQVGTANFVNPCVCNTIINDLQAYITRKKIENITSLIGAVKI